jgi:hypothetical protein
VVPAELSYTLTLEELDKSEIKSPGESNIDRVHISCELRFKNPPVSGFTRELFVSYSPEYEDAVLDTAIQDNRLKVFLKPRPDWIKDEQSN